MILDALFAPRVRASTLANPTPMMLDAFGIQPSAAGVAINEQTATTISAVWCAINLLANSFKSLNLNLCKRTSQGKTIVQDHPALRVLNQVPNPQWTPSRQKSYLHRGKSLWGNGYAMIRRNGAGDLDSTWPIGPWRVIPKRRPDDTIVYEVKNASGAPTYVDDYDMLHLMGFSYDGVSGVSVIRRARDSMGLALAAENFGNKFFGNNATPKVILRHPAKLSPEASQRLRQSWVETYGGQNALGTAVLEEGMEATFVPMNNEDAQFLQTRAFQIPEVSRWFHITPHLLHDMTHAHYANIEQTNIEYATTAVMPDADDFEEECDRKLLTEAERDSGLYFEFDMEGLFRADVKTQREADATDVQNGIRSRNECRRKRGENPIDGEEGDAYTIQVNMMNLERVMDEPEPPEPSSTTGNGPPTPPSKAPENEPPPSDKESANDLREAITAAHLGLFESTISRMCRVADNARKRAPKEGPAFILWRQKYRGDFSIKLHDAIGPLCDAYADALAAVDKSDSDPEAVFKATEASVSDVAAHIPAGPDDNIPMTANVHAFASRTMEAIAEAVT